jgi:hypothetical protein
MVLKSFEISQYQFCRSFLSRLLRYCRFGDLSNLIGQRKYGALDFLSGPTGKAEIVPSDTWNGNSLPTRRAGQLNWLRLPSTARDINKNRNTTLYHWVFYRNIWRSNRNALDIDKSIVIDWLVTTDLDISPRSRGVIRWCCYVYII